MQNQRILWPVTYIVVTLSCFFAARNSWAEGNVEVLQQGPVHEAFIETITNEPQPGIVVDRTPPDRINELPPDVRPDGNKLVWIPGYWLWDEDRKDFVWVSGLWRNAPPGRRWVPGYWSPLEKGYQWISGFWAPEEAEQIEYLPDPPENLEQGANRPTPSDDHFWVPGCWVWQSNGYAWRPGYWGRIALGWTWIPAHYQYTPRGVVYVGGYWDYALAGRGFLLAPVYFTRPIYLQPGYVYRPNSLIELGLITASLFIQPRYRHYYYGNYFGPNYYDRGFYPWYSYNSKFRGYDPLFPYYRWHNERHRNDVNWQKDLVKDYERRAKQPNAGLSQLADKKDKEALQARSLTRSLQDVAVEAKSRNKADDNLHFEKRINQMQHFRDERKNSELSANRGAQTNTLKQQAITNSESRNGKSAKLDSGVSSKNSVERWQVPKVETGKFKQQNNNNPGFSTPPAPKSNFGSQRSKPGNGGGSKPPKQGGSSGKGKGGKK